MLPFAPLGWGRAYPPRWLWLSILMVWLAYRARPFPLSGLLPVMFAAAAVVLSWIELPLSFPNFVAPLVFPMAILREPPVGVSRAPPFLLSGSSSVLAV